MIQRKQLAAVQEAIDTVTSKQFPVEILSVVIDYLRGAVLLFDPNRLFSGGVFEYLGTRGGTREWCNPAVPGDDRLVIMRSSREFVHGKVENCIGVHSGNVKQLREWNELDNLPDNWYDVCGPAGAYHIILASFLIVSRSCVLDECRFSVDLGENRSLIPTHYTLMVRPDSTGTGSGRDRSGRVKN